MRPIKLCLDARCANLSPFNQTNRIRRNRVRITSTPRFHHELRNELPRYARNLWNGCRVRETDDYTTWMRHTDDILYKSINRSRSDVRSLSFCFVFVFFLRFSNSKRKIGKFFVRYVLDLIRYFLSDFFFLFLDSDFSLWWGGTFLWMVVRLPQTAVSLFEEFHLVRLVFFFINFSIAFS